MNGKGFNKTNSLKTTQVITAYPLKLLIAVSVIEESRSGHKLKYSPIILVISTREQPSMVLSAVLWSLGFLKEPHHE